MPQKHACLYQTRFATDKIPPVSTQEDQEWIKITIMKFILGVDLLNLKKEIN